MRRLVPVLVLLSGCSFVEGDGPGYRGPDDYAYTLSVGCFCWFRSPLRITVEDGAVVDVEIVEPPDDASSDADPIVAQWSLTLRELTALVRRAEREAAQADVSYDAAYGFPTTAYIDWNRGIADDEVSYRVTDFEPR